MDKNIQDMLGGILGALPTNKQQEVQNCESKDDFLGVLGSVKGLDIGSLLGKADQSAEIFLCHAAQVADKTDSFANSHRKTLLYMYLDIL